MPTGRAEPLEPRRARALRAAGLVVAGLALAALAAYPLAGILAVRALVLAIARAGVGECRGCEPAPPDAAVTRDGWMVAGIIQLGAPAGSTGPRLFLARGAPALADGTAAVLEELPALARRGTTPMLRLVPRDSVRGLARVGTLHFTGTSASVPVFGAPGTAARKRS